MSGQLLRSTSSKAGRHECAPPDQAEQGAVWQCDCGKRWTCVNHVTERPGRVTMQADWRRRYWPWPRRNQEDPAETARWEAEKAATAGGGGHPVSVSDVGMAEPAVGPTAPSGVSSANSHCPGCRCGE